MNRKILISLALIVFFNLISTVSGATSSTLDISATVLGVSAPAIATTGLFLIVPTIGAIIIGGGLLIFVMGGIFMGDVKYGLIYGVIAMVIGISMLGVFVSMV